MFAFALFDRERQRLLLVRDRLGIKPLYYRFADGVLLFGSELGALRRHPRFDPSIDAEALGGYLRFGYVTGERSIYADTRRLMPGEYLVWEDGAVSRGDWWRLGDPPGEPPPERFEEVVERLDGLLGDAVERRMIADVPLGAFLSGGVDSSTVVALMQERASRSVRTFSIGFEEPEFDEAPYAAAVARHLGTEHTEFYVGRDDVAAVAREIPLLYDEPFADSSAIPTLLLSRLTRRHVTVALSGDGGDELFSGYRQYAQMARLEPLLHLPGWLRRALAGAAPLVRSPSLRNGLSHLAAEDACGVGELLLTHFPYADVRAAAGTVAARPRRAYGDAFRSAPTDDPVRRASFADARTYLPDDILTKLDRASMSVGLEARVPLLDHRVVEFCMALPRRIVWRGAPRSKAPLRALLERRVPAALIDRPKRGFTLPLHRLLARELADWTRRYLDPARVAEERHLDPAGVARLLRHTHGGDHLAATRLWFLICFQRWFACTHRGEPV
jgi:asparagine synthase (glutamine-hydrolysing)